MGLRGGGISLFFFFCLSFRTSSSLSGRNVNIYLARYASELGSDFTLQSQQGSNNQGKWAAFLMVPRRLFLDLYHSTHEFLIHVIGQKVSMNVFV